MLRLVSVWRSLQLKDKHLRQIKVTSWNPMTRNIFFNLGSVSCIFLVRGAVGLKPLLHFIQVIKRGSNTTSIFYISPFQNEQSDGHSGVSFVCRVSHVVYNDGTVKCHCVQHHLRCSASLLQCLMFGNSNIVLNGREYNLLSQFTKLSPRQKLRQKILGRKINGPMKMIWYSKYIVGVN